MYTTRAEAVARIRARATGRLTSRQIDLLADLALTWTYGGGWAPLQDLEPIILRVASDPDDTPTIGDIHELALSSPHLPLSWGIALEDTGVLIDSGWGLVAAIVPEGAAVYTSWGWIDSGEPVWTCDMGETGTVVRRVQDLLENVSSVLQCAGGDW